MAYSLFEKIDNFAIDEILKSKFGGEDSVVLCEMYPDCMNRLSPDTTDQRHSHRILMITDSNVSNNMSLSTVTFGCLTDVSTTA